MTNRDAKILEILTESGRIEVTRLAGLLGVSQVTARKDLDRLESKGLIRREHGYAQLCPGGDTPGRLAYHYEVKRRIAQAAAALVRDGETVMLESGSCCALLAEALARKNDVTLVTNSAFIAGHIRRLRARVVLLGGDYQNEDQVLVGPITRKCAESFFVEKLFIGTCGFTMRYGFTGSDHLRAQTARDMAAQANQVIILTESAKFQRQGVAPLIPLDRISAVFTDDAIPPDTEAFLLEKGIALEKVPCRE